MTLAQNWSDYQDAMAKVREAKAEASKVTCLRCGKPMISSDHYACRHDEPEFRIMEEIMGGER